MFSIKKYICFLLLLLSVEGKLFALSAKATEIPLILVSVAPHKFFVEKIAKETAQVYLMVPAGASSHTYEPTARQMIQASRAAIWFRIGEPFEKRAIQALKSHHPELEIVDLRQNVHLIQTDPRHKGCCKGAEDLHFWLSARQASIQAETITVALVRLFPQHADFYWQNLRSFQQELQELDQEIQGILASLQERTIFVSHPAYAYFCRDYNLTQYSVEVEGKDPTPKQIHLLLNLARKLQIRTIFIQIQYKNKAAGLLADELHAKLVTLDPYSEHYFTSMREIAHAFADK